MWTWYLPHMARIRETVADEALGEIRAVSADHTQLLPTDPAHRLNALALGGGALLDLGNYPFSFVWEVLGAPTEVRALGRLGETGTDTEATTVMTHAGGAVSTTLSSSRVAGPDTTTIVGTKVRIEIDRLWYTPASFHQNTSDGTALEEYVSRVENRGMGYHARAAERFVAEGTLDSDLLPVVENAAIMRCLDEIRSQIGVRYPGENDA